MTMKTNDRATIIFTAVAIVMTCGAGVFFLFPPTPKQILAATTAIGSIVGLLLLLAVYFIPAIAGRQKRNAQAIFLLNLFLGWTFIGWVVALIWAHTKDSGER